MENRMPGMDTTCAPQGPWLALSNYVPNVYTIFLKAELNMLMLVMLI